MGGTLAWLPLTSTGGGLLPPLGPVIGWNRSKRFVVGASVGRNFCYACMAMSAATLVNLRITKQRLSMRAEQSNGKRGNAT
jgi:hypothetical protein